MSLYRCEVQESTHVKENRRTMKRGSWILRFKPEEGKTVHCDECVLSTLNSLQNAYSGCVEDSGNYCENKTESMEARETERAGTVADFGSKDVDKRESSRVGSVVSSRDIDEHLKAVELEVIAATEKQLSQAEEDRYAMASIINQETEREIRKLYERRDERLRNNHQMIEKRRQKIVEKRFELVGQIHALSGEIIRNAERLKMKQGGGTKSASSSPRLHAKLAKKLSGHSNKNGGDCTAQKNKSVSCGMEEITKMVQELALGISFMKLDGERVGKIIGASDRWVLEEKIEVAPMVGVPALKGAINDVEIVIEDVKTSSIYVTNVKDKSTRMVIEERMPLFNCASHDGTVIVCGSRSGRVALYDKSWTHLRNLTLPEKFLSGAEVMCVTVDSTGRILIAQYGGSNIHVFNPSGSQWLRTIELEEMIPIHGIHALPQGIAVHSAMYGEQVCILDRDDMVKNTIFLEESEEKCMSILTADKVSNTLFNLTCEETTGQCMVEELCDVMVAKQTRPEKVIEFAAPRLANGLIAGEGFCLLRPDKMVTCDGEQLLVFGKRKGLEHLRSIVSQSHPTSKHERDTHR